MSDGGYLAVNFLQVLVQVRVDDTVRWAIFPDEFQQPQDAGQGIIDLVGDTSAQPAQGTEFFGMAEGGVGLLQRPCPLLDLLLQGGVQFGQSIVGAFEAEHGPHPDQKFGMSGRAEEEFVGTGIQRCGRGREVVGRCDDDDGNQGGGNFFDLAHSLPDVAIEGKEDKVGRPDADGLQERLSSGSISSNVAGGLEHLGHPPAEFRLSPGDKDFGKKERRLHHSRCLLLSPKLYTD